MRRSAFSLEERQSGGTRRSRPGRVLLRASCVALGLLLGIADSCFAGESPIDDVTTDEIHRVIQRQIEAFKSDDAKAAFALADPSVQQLFGTPERFLGMVREQYKPLYRPRSVRFGMLRLVDGEYSQEVSIVGPDRVPVLVLYLVDKHAVGEWRILACVVLYGKKTAT